MARQSLTHTHTTHTHAHTHTTHTHTRTHAHVHTHALGDGEVVMWCDGETITHAHTRTHTHAHARTHTHAHAHTHSHAHVCTHTLSVKNKSALLKGECRHYHWRYLDTAWAVGHYCANLQRPLRRPKNFGALKAQYLALCEDDLF